jgi:hypothetical protein
MEQNRKILKRNPGKYVFDGSIIGYKKILCDCGIFSFIKKPIEAVATLEVPPGSTIVHPNHSIELRTNVAIVRKIELNNNDTFSKKECHCYSMMDHDFKYKLGKRHEPEEILDEDITNTNPWQNCSGIHFFLKKYDAHRFRWEKPSFHYYHRE